jgi:hypothetical protein
MGKYGSAVPPRRLVKSWLKETEMNEEEVRKRMMLWSIEKSEVSQIELNEEGLTSAELEAFSACKDVC